MTRRMIGLLAAFVATVVTLGVSAGSVVTQERPGSATAASTAAQSWNVPRTADGQPDIQGMWNPGDWGRPLETPAPDTARRPAAPRGGGPPSEEGWSDVKTTTDRTP